MSSAEPSRSKDSDDWRPIETAPKDGSRVLLVRPSGLVELGAHDGRRWCESHIAGPSLPGIFRGWMPLPQPPQY